jgi:hypothetical protein
MNHMTHPTEPVHYFLCGLYGQPTVAINAECYRATLSGFQCKSSPNVGKYLPIEMWNLGDDRANLIS